MKVGGKRNDHKRFRPAAEISGTGHEKVHGAAETAAGASTSRRAAAGSGKRHEIPQHPHRAGDSLRGVLHFDSQKEARRFDVLAARQARGQIRDLRLQVDFTLQEAFTDTEGKRVRAIRYKADFTYYQPPNRQLYGSHAPYYAEQSGVSWEFVVEDVKSKATRTAKYAMKKKMLKDRFGYDITEV